MLKHTARFAAFALLMFAASATPITANAGSSQFHSPILPPAIGSQFDGPNPYPPVPPSSCLPAPCTVRVIR
jgi:hypothetical protein